MSEQQLKILNLLAEGKINSEEANRLLNAINSKPADEPLELKSRKLPRNLIVRVKAEKGTAIDKDINIKIPILLLKAGIKVGSFLPKDAKDNFSHHFSHNGFDLDLNKIDASNIEEFIQALQENPIEFKTDKEDIRIYCE